MIHDWCPFSDYDLLDPMDNQEIFRKRRSVQEESSDVLNKNQEKNRENFKNFCREENNKLF